MGRLGRPGARVLIGAVLAVGVLAEAPGPGGTFSFDSPAG